MIVVDTQAVIWLTQGGDQLSETAARSLAEGRTEGRLAIADITLHEIGMLMSKGRVSVNTSPGIYLEFVESLFRVLPVTAKIAERAVNFGAGYPKDPADRLIGATALIHGAKLVTRDEQIRQSGEVDCIW